MRFEELLLTMDKERRDRSLFHDLMRYRVSEILLVGSLYDSFVVESDGFLTEQITGEYSKLNLSTIPRVTSAYTDESALMRLESGDCDLVIIMVGLDYDRPLRLAQEMRLRKPGLPILLLVLNNSSLAEMDPARPEFEAIDRVFVWNGYSKLLVGMIKYVEDRGNADADVASGLVRVILIIEDSIRYYSRYLPLIYTVLLKQTRTLIEEERGVETYRLLRARARPKILLASTYEEAEALFLRYESSLLAVITDLRFQHRGRFDPEAGFDFVAMARGRRPELRVMIQSSEEGVRDRAANLGVVFADKSSESLAAELGGFIRQGIGFGEFVFLGPDGEALARASTIDEFARLVAEVPPDSLLRHAARNEFSSWLTARGEYRFAALLHDYTIEDFSTPEDLRAFLLHVLDQVRLEKSEGLVPEFDEVTFRYESSMGRLGSGSVGGKGRGIEFLGRLIREEHANPTHGEWFIGMPRTLFIGIDEFEDFLERNGLWSQAYYDAPPDACKASFAASSLSANFVETARRFLQVCYRPLAVRSSGLLEDMVRLPLAGVYGTRFLSNRGDLETRLSSFLEAVKEVWRSLFSEAARRHIAAAGYSLEEERMGVVVQELVGRERNGCFMPLVSAIVWSRSPRVGSSNTTPVIALVPGMGSALTGFCPSLIVSLDNENPPDIPAVGPWARAARALKLDVSSPQAASDLVHVGHEVDAAAITGRMMKRLQGSGVLAAFSRLLEMASLAFKDEVIVEFAIDETALDRRPYISLLQIRPYHRAASGRGTSLDPAEAVSSSGLRKVLVAEGELYGRVPALPITDIVVFETWPPIDESAWVRIRLLDWEAGKRRNGWILVLPPPAEDSESVYRGILWPDVSHAAAILQADPSGIGSPLGSHLFHDVVAGGALWLGSPSLSPTEFRSRLVGFGFRAEGESPFAHYRLETQERFLATEESTLYLVDRLR
ncbi:MAG TPA: PEP/pyruvate-binding domain-containing protein [Rectinemataceae bacterium]|nr:PEP/pyruvate-binding domain-containing protein [Rectinemataceae bacterium]